MKRADILFGALAKAAPAEQPGNDTPTMGELAAGAMSTRITNVIQAMQLPAPATRQEPNSRQESQQRASEMRREYKRAWQRAKRRGEPWHKGNLHQPTTGIYSPMLKGISSAPAPTTEARFRSRRERANELRERMAAFSSIYNAAWLVREAYFGPDERLRRTVEALLRTFADELRKTQDYEAVVFAIVDALHCSPSGVPWEP